MATSTELISLTQQVSALQDDATNFKAASNYFSDILNAQLVIFSVIVAVLLALSWLFNYKISRDRIKNAVTEEVNKVKKEINESIEKTAVDTQSRLDALSREQAKDVTGLRGEIYRTLGQFHDSEKNYAIAFIWWMRAASSYAETGDEKLTRISLGAAKESVEKVQYAFSLDYEFIGEFQEIMGALDKTKYRLEREMLDKAMKDALAKKQPTTNPSS